MFTALHNLFLLAPQPASSTSLGPNKNNQKRHGFSKEGFLGSSIEKSRKPETRSRPSPFCFGSVVDVVADGLAFNGRLMALQLQICTLKGKTLTLLGSPKGQYFLSVACACEGIGGLNLFYVCFIVTSCKLTSMIFNWVLAALG